MASSDASKKPRRYAFACSGCRRKKIKCDGEIPACHNCTSRELPCSYPLDRQSDRDHRRISESITAHAGAAEQAEQDPQPRSGPTLSAASPSLASPGSAQIQSTPTAVDEWAEIGFDQDGTLAFHGPTSRFHTALDDETPVRKSRLQARSKEQQIHELAANSRLQARVWQPLLAAQTQTVDSIPAAVTEKILDIYWTWQHPLHNCVYKPYFIRDMSLGGPYYSKFLLMSIYALAGRLLSLENDETSLVQKGEVFIEKAKLLLLEEISSYKPKIPTIQALLILAGRQCAVGKISEGWLYTGMAIRMMRDVGLHLTPNRLEDYENLDAGDLEARKRLYLSAYIWDKTISISLGRPPTLITIPAGVEDILDFNDDSTIWRPVTVDSLDLDYPIVASFATSTFKEFCRLGEIITRIYATIYTRSDRELSLDPPERLEAELRSWHDHIPDHLKMTELDKLTFCPPPHIYSLNLLYHTLFILIYRPFFHLPKGREKCIGASIIINEYLLLYMRTFNIRIMTFLVTYCIYTAATINVMEIKSTGEGDVAAVANRLKVSLSVLEQEVKQTPGAHRSVDIIKSQLRSSRVSGPAMPHAPPLFRPHADGNGPVDGENIAANIARPVEPGFWVAKNTLVPPEINDSNTLDEDFTLVDDWNFWDIAGGFQPDAYRWTFDDAFPQASSSGA